jgi:hypothetical protein
MQEQLPRYIAKRREARCIRMPARQTSVAISAMICIAW